MIAYASNTTTKKNIAAIRLAGWRILLSPEGCSLDAHGLRYGLDNGAWTAYNSNRVWDATLFRKTMQSHGSGADWIVVPDIVAGGRLSLDLSLRWLGSVLEYTERALIPVQDGMGIDWFRGLLSSHVGIFIGGTTKWKLDTLNEWCRYANLSNAYAHVARVNTAKRIHLCAMAGADSFDGSNASRFSKNTPALERARSQLVFK